MSRKLVAAILGGLLLTAPGCQKKMVSHFMAYESMGEPLYESKVAFAASAQRYIAERHVVEIIAPESELQKSWESAVAFCGTIQCEVMSSSIATRVGSSAPSGTMSLRVGPQDLTKLFAYLQKLGKIAQHTTEREDKTTAVLDTDAKVQNLTSFRDNLRAMLAKPSATVKDLLEIQQQLMETQSQLDSETAQRKILANETEKIAVGVSFRVKESTGNAGGWAEIRDALRESGSVLAQSTAFLLTAIFAVIPWLILFVPALWLLAKGWRRLRRKGASAAPQSQTKS